MNIQEITNKVEAVLDQAEEALYIHTIVEQAMVSKDDATNALKRLAAQGLVDCTPTQGRWGNRYALIRSAKPVTTEAQRQEQAVSRLEEVLAEGGLKLPTTPEGLAEALRDAHDGLPEGVKQALNEVDLDEPANAAPPDESDVDEAHDRDNHICAAAAPCSATWMLYQHEDGRYAVAPSPELASFAHREPAWHRVGPVEVYGVEADQAPEDDPTPQPAPAPTVGTTKRTHKLTEIAVEALYNHGEAAQAMLDIITHPDGEYAFNGLVEDSRRAYMRAVYFHVCSVNEALYKIGGAE